MSLVAFGSARRCRVLRLASPFIDGGVFWLKESPGQPASSIILFYYCLDSWTVVLPSIIVLAAVELTVLDGGAGFNNCPAYSRTHC